MLGHPAPTGSSSAYGTRCADTCGLQTYESTRGIQERGTHKCVAANVAGVGSHAVFGEMQSCCISQKVYLQASIKAESCAAASLVWVSSFMAPWQTSSKPSAMHHVTQDTLFATSSAEDSGGEKCWAGAALKVHLLRPDDAAQVQRQATALRRAPLASIDGGCWQHPALLVISSSITPLTWLYAPPGAPRSACTEAPSVLTL